MQVVLVYLQPFRRNSVLKCALRPKIATNSLKTLFGGPRSFKVIDVDKFKKPITSACYDKQHVCTYLQPFSHYKSHQQQNNVFLDGTPLWHRRSGATPAPRGHKILSRKTRDLEAAKSEDFVILGVAVLIQCQDVADGQTDGQTQTDRRPGHG